MKKNVSFFTELTGCLFALLWIPFAAIFSLLKDCVCRDNHWGKYKRRRKK